MEETKYVKLTDKAIYRVVSESPGRNASEPIGGPDKKKEIRKPSSLLSSEGNTSNGKLNETVVRSGGVVGVAR